jgi:hypothetical protein
MRIVAALLLSICVATFAGAGEYDINYLFQTPHSGSIEPTLGRGQTFQMGKAGSLDQIIVRAGFFNGGQTVATLNLYELTGDESNGAALPAPIASSTAILPGNGIQANHAFNFQNLSFPAGKKLAFAMFGHISISIGLGLAPPPNSTPIVVSNGNIFYTLRTASFATVITPVPEPSTLSLALVPALAIFRGRRTSVR